MNAQHSTVPPVRLQPAIKYVTELSKLLSAGQNEDKSSLRVVHAAHTTGLNANSKLYELPAEVMELILDHLVHIPKVLPFGERASLSTESFASAPPHIPEDLKYLNKFRKLCSKFFHAGTNRRFGRQNIRFSLQSFQRIRDIAEYPKNQWIPLDVLKVSYMVHDLYPQNESRLREILNDCSAKCEQKLKELQAGDIQNTQSTLAAQKLHAELERCRRNEQIVGDVMTRASEQRLIIENNIDEISLVKALSSFKNLQQIRLMRNVDDLDRSWKGFVNSQPVLRAEFGASQWTTACERATLVLGRAYRESNSKSNRLSSRFMDPGPVWLQNYISEADVSSLYERLTCLELQIGDPLDLEQKMLDLSSAFGTLFGKTKMMKGLHIGLLGREPISIPLETIFHNVEWKNLQYIGFSKWRLNGQEIINFIQRHRKITSVRFREVQLKSGSWLDIVKFIRQNTKLEWASFRQVGYFPSIGGGPIMQTGRPPPPAGFASLRGPPSDDYEEYSSDGSIFRRHVASDPGTDEAAEPEVFAEDGDSEADDNDSDETVEAVDDTVDSGEDHEETTSSSNDDAEESVYEGDDEDDAAESLSRSVTGDSEVGVVNDLALDDRVMVQHSSANDYQHSNCQCSNGYSWHDLEDDFGLDPTKAQWKSWERWVRRPCREHDPLGP